MPTFKTMNAVSFDICIDVHGNLVLGNSPSAAFVLYGKGALVPEGDQARVEEFLASLEKPKAPVEEKAVLATPENKRVAKKEVK